MVNDRTHRPQGIDDPYGERVPAVPELDLARIRRYCAAKVPVDLRDKGARRGRCPRKVRDNLRLSTTLALRRHRLVAVPVAQLRYTTDNNTWTLYWADRNGRWHRYQETEPGTVEQLLNEIDQDPTCIFWG